MRNGPPRIAADTARAVHDGRGARHRDDAAGRLEGRSRSRFTRCDRTSGPAGRPEGDFGIGPKLEKVLNDLGIWTYGQIAAWSEAQVAWLDDHLGISGRIGRDDWVGQARKLGG